MLTADLHALPCAYPVLTAALCAPAGTTTISHRMAASQWPTRGAPNIACHTMYARRSTDGRCSTLPWVVLRARRRRCRCSSLASATATSTSAASTASSTFRTTGSAIQPGHSPPTGASCSSGHEATPRRAVTWSWSQRMMRRRHWPPLRVPTTGGLHAASADR